MRFAMDGNCRFSTRGVDQTEYRTFGLVEPILQVIYSVLALHLKVLLVSTGDRFCSQVCYVRVRVHIQWNLNTLPPLSYEMG